MPQVLQMIVGLGIGISLPLFIVWLWDICINAPQEREAHHLQFEYLKQYYREVYESHTSS